MAINMVDHEPETTTPPNDMDDLAAEYLARRSGGEDVALEAYLKRLPASDHAEFRDLVQGAQAVEQALPRTLVTGTMLLDRYRIVDEIGQGGMGRVFRAWDERLQRHVAIKALASLAVGDPLQEELLLKESRLLAALQHPNIVAIHEAERDDDLTFIVMDLVDGVSLSEVIERARTLVQRRHGGSKLSPHAGSLLSDAIGKPTPDGRPDLVDPKSWYQSVARVVCEIARTLEAAHGHDVVHRDLKPSNLMLLGGGSPVVLDFGLAGSGAIAGGDVTQGLYGTVAYLAPEQARSCKVGMDPRTDVYQIGLILYELLTLHRAFPGDGIALVMENVKNGLFRAPRKLNPQVPADLGAICLKAMELSPERRYATARELREDLERYLEGREVPHAVRSNVPRAMARNVRYMGRRHPLASATAGMLAVGLSVFGYFLAFSPSAMLKVHRPFRFSPGADRPVQISLSSDDVRPHDMLGVTVDNQHESAHVYALSVFGGASPDDRLVRPMTPLTMKQLADGMDPDDRPRKGEWDLQVGSGEQLIVCTMVDAAAENVDYEGLMVFVTPDPDKGFEDWFGVLAQASTHRPDGAFPYELAIEYLDPKNRPKERGRPVPSGQVEFYSKLPDKLLGKTPWEDDDVPHLEVHCRVVKE